MRGTETNQGGGCCRGGVGWLIRPSLSSNHSCIQPAIYHTDVRYSLTYTLGWSVLHNTTHGMLSIISYPHHRRRKGVEWIVLTQLIITHPPLDSARKQVFIQVTTSLDFYPGTLIRDHQGSKFMPVCLPACLLCYPLRLVVVVYCIHPSTYPSNIPIYAPRHSPRPPPPPSLLITFRRLLPGLD